MSSNEKNQIDKHLGSLLDTLITMAIKAGRCHSDQKFAAQAKELESKCSELKNDVVRLVSNDHEEMDVFKAEITEFMKTAYEVDKELAEGKEKSPVVKREKVKI